MKKWYLVFTKPRQEEVASTNLIRQEYEIYLPMMLGKRKRLQRVSRVPMPMFPRYLFIHLAEGVDNWAPIRSTRGVISMVRFGSMPRPVPDDLITFLKGRENQFGYHDPALPDIEPGSKIRITGGPMEGYEGICRVKTAKERVEILLDIVGKEARVSIPIDQVELVT